MRKLCGEIIRRDFIQILALVRDGMRRPRRRHRWTVESRTRYLAARSAHTCKSVIYNTLRVAEGEGFEPPEPLPVEWFSRPFVGGRSTSSSQFTPIKQAFLAHDLGADWGPSAPVHGQKADTPPLPRRHVAARARRPQQRQIADCRVLLLAAAVGGPSAGYGRAEPSVVPACSSRGTSRAATGGARQ
jgi:hypothetical protein